MPAERRSLRSNNKSDTSSSANGEKVRSNSQSSSAKDKAAPTTRAAANKASKAPAKKGATKGASNTGMGEDDQSHGNASKSAENGVNGSEDVEMGEDTAGAPTSSFNSGKDRNGDEKMTVVVPPAKGSRSSGKLGQDKEEDVTMKGVDDDDAVKAELEVDPTTKAIQGWSDPFLLSNEDGKSRHYIHAHYEYLTFLYEFQTSRPTSPCSSEPSSTSIPDLPFASYGRYRLCGNILLPRFSPR
jgi:hypothetical protein